MSILTKIKEVLSPKPQKGPVFNAVLEGTYQDDLSNCHFKLVKLEIPQNIGIIETGNEKYLLIFQVIDKENDLSVEKIRGGKLSHKISDGLGWMEGCVLDSPVPILACVRSIYLSDGRIFVREHELKNTQYADNWVEDIAKISIKQIFVHFDKKYPT